MNEYKSGLGASGLNVGVLPWAPRVRKEHYSRFWPFGNLVLLPTPRIAYNAPILMVLLWLIIHFDWTALIYWTLGLASQWKPNLSLFLSRLLSLEGIASTSPPYAVSTNYWHLWHSSSSMELLSYSLNMLLSTFLVFTFSSSQQDTIHSVLSLSG